MQLVYPLPLPIMPTADPCAAMSLVAGVRAVDVDVEDVSVSSFAFFIIVRQRSEAHILRNCLPAILAAFDVHVSGFRLLMPYVMLNVLSDHSLFVERRTAPGA